jgi:glutamyl-tRNA synthetase
MRISHVIRGNDHLSNTPKQVLCYEALGFPVPVFAHVSLILGADRARLSKRHGATSVQAYRDEGIMPEALVNYLVRLGWSHGDQEIFSRAELIERFDIKGVSASGAVFDQTKLEWLSQEYIKRADRARLAALVRPFIAEAGLPAPDDARLAPMLDTLRERAKTLREMVEVGRFYFERPSGYDEAARAKLFTATGAERLDVLIDRLPAVEPFAATAIEALYRELVAAMQLKLVDLAQLTRLAITGRTASPPLFDVLALLGRDEVLTRLRAARQAIGAPA